MVASAVTVTLNGVGYPNVVRARVAGVSGSVRLLLTEAWRCAVGCSSWHVLRCLTRTLSQAVLKEGKLYMAWLRRTAAGMMDVKLVLQAASAW